MLLCSNNPTSSINGVTESYLNTWQGTPLNSAEYWAYISLMDLFYIHLMNNMVLCINSIIHLGSVELFSMMTYATTEPTGTITSCWWLRCDRVTNGVEGRCVYQFIVFYLVQSVNKKKKNYNIYCVIYIMFSLIPYPVL